MKKALTSVLKLILFGTTTENAKIKWLGRLACPSLTARVNNLATLYFYYPVTQCALTASKNNAEEYDLNPDSLKITSLCPILWSLKHHRGKSFVCPTVNCWYNAVTLSCGRQNAYSVRDCKEILTQSNYFFQPWNLKCL